MAKQYQALQEEHQRFISAQKIFFVGTAAASGSVNISPKGMNTFKVISSTRVLWLNVTGSGNETAAHVHENPRMTMMFVSFTDAPLILRIYGNARVVHQADPEWDAMIASFDAFPGVRQIFDISVHLVQTSCGMSVPLMDYVGEREQLNQWATAKGEQGIQAYWAKNNQVSIDGFPTYLIRKKS